jgi:mRNA degradation ribonuclease J1/J2
MEPEFTLQELLNIAKAANLKYVSMTTEQLEYLINLERRLENLERQVDRYSREKYAANDMGK